MFRWTGLYIAVVLAAPLQASEPTEEHPLMPVLRLARERYERLGSQIRDYSCTLVKRERIDGQLGETEFLTLKLRHEESRAGRVVVPFSVYLHFQAPATLAGREVVYVAGKHGGNLIARRGGNRFAFFTTSLKPTANLAMDGNRYPLTEIGIKNLIKRLIEVGTAELQYGECIVKYYPNTKINDRVCTTIEVTHPLRRDHFESHVARIFIDDELGIPIRYAAYDWPKEEGGRPQLIEEYTYLDLKLNRGLSDWDFDHRNESYAFRKDFIPNDTNRMLTSTGQSSSASASE